MINRPVKIATRGSKLALYQANKVKKTLENYFQGLVVEIEIIKTKGDKILDVALSKIGDKGLFTKELENSLLSLETDIAVHSLKDLPTELPEGLMLGGVLERGEVRDALISIHGKKLNELTSDDVIATSSLRRKAQLLAYNPSFKIVDIRGNVDTRVKKMQDGYCTAMVMACAGIQRLGMGNLITEILDPMVMMPAVSQGAIALEIRNNDSQIAELVSVITHPETYISVNAERTFLKTLEGGCQIPIGCFTQLNDENFKIYGFVSNPEGTRVLKFSGEGNSTEASQIAFRLANRFLENGAGEIVQQIRNAIE